MQALLDWYGLAAPLASQLRERSAGNPMYAVQLVGSWVERGWLEPSSEGLVLSRGHSAVLADGLRDVWMRRLDRALAHRTEREEEYLERAAVLGPSVDHADWDGVCRPDGAPMELLEELLNRQLARPVGAKLGGGWAFVHPMLREALLARARSAGRFETHHEACVVWLAGRPGPGVAERLGRHLVGAGRPREALGPMLQAARERRNRGDRAGALAQVARREQALRRMGIPQDDPRWAPGWLEQARVHEVGGELEAMAASLERAASVARPNTAVGVDVTLERARLHSRAGQLEQALTHADAALELSERLDLRRLQAVAVGVRCSVLVMLGRLDEADVGARQAQALHSDLRNPMLSWQALELLGSIAAQRGKAAEAEAWAHQALDVARRTGFRRGQAASLLVLGDLARQGGRLDEALRLYLQGASAYRGVGSAAAIGLIDHNVGLVHLARGDLAAAEAALCRAGLVVAARGQGPMSADLLMAQAACAAGVGDRSTAESYLCEARALYRAVGGAEVDSLWVCEQFAAHARRSGLDGLVREGLNLARHHAQLLAWPRRVGEIDARLSLLADEASLPARPTTEAASE